MNEVMGEYRTWCPECEHLWVSSHFQGEAPCPCKECGCQWAITIKMFHDLANEMVDHEGKPPEVKPVPMTSPARIEGKARKPFNAERFWVWLIVGILIIFLWAKWTRNHRDHEERLPVGQTIEGIEGQETRELLEEIIRLIEEGSKEGLDWGGLHDVLPRLGSFFGLTVSSAWQIRKGKV